MPDFLNKLTGKFYWGLALIISSLILGKVTQFIFFFYFEDNTLLWLSIIVYILSWPMLIVGAWMIGTEYYESLKRYFGYKFYQESLKKSTQKMLQVTREKTDRLKSGVKNKISLIKPLKKREENRQRPENQA
jgi:hypothetical protein